MIIKRVIYSEPQAVFIQDALTNNVASKMKATADEFNVRPGKAEMTSWQNNAPRICALLQLANVQDTQVTFEYLVPYNMKRIDCMIYGKGADGKGNVIHIELKQWDNHGVKEAKSGGNFEVNEETIFKVEAFTGGANRIVAHPSQQVRGYQDYLSNFIQVISEKELNLTGLAYCYNYIKNNPALPTALYDEKYSDLLNAYPTYAGDQVQELADEMHELLCDGDGLSIFNKMMNSPIAPSKKLLEEASELVDKGDITKFSLIEDQIVARNIILDKIRNLDKHNKKSVIIVKGGPGTGKTVIALHLIALLAKSKRALKIHYATKSKPLLEGVKSRLPRGSKAKMLFTNCTQFIPANCESNSEDVLLVDEAHRISKSPNNQFTKADKRTDLSQIDTLVRCARIAVFFIDDKQAIRSLEIGSTEMIRESAIKYGADIEEVQLTSQFRCNGSDNYLDWLDQVLYNEEVSSSFSTHEFDFQIMDTPQKLYAAIAEKDGQVLPNGKVMSARLTAGFCWEWSKTLGDDGDLVKDVRIASEDGIFEMPWETHGDIKNVPEKYCLWYEWAYKPQGINQVGCIYTAQGFEFDYVGVIIGNDLMYSKANNCIRTNISATKDPTLLRNKVDFDKYVRNIYRVLMSRGMKGCYVYIQDPELKAYMQEKLQTKK